MDDYPFKQRDTGIERSAAETGQPHPTSMTESEGASEVAESQVQDDLDMLILADGGHIPWCPLTPFFNLLAYVLENTVYREVTLKKFDSTEDRIER